MNVTGTGIAVAVAIVVVGGFLFLGNAILGFFAPAPALGEPEFATTTLSMQESQSMNTEESTGGLPQELPTTLTVKDTVVGTGAEAVAGKSVTVHYLGMLPDGTVFDGSKKRGQPFTFTLGAGQVIAGWDQGVAGMKVGGTRQLIIPPDMGYGAQGAGGVIPPNATLIFEVELLEVK
jgi:FKBP-type peptidyl-prolyl cis-trans isomerase